jgi:hypothetical protein
MCSGHVIICNNFIWEGSLLAVRCVSDIICVNCGRIWNLYACAKMLLYEGSVQKCDASGKKLMCDDDRTVLHHWNEAAKSILILNNIIIRSEVTPQLGSWPHLWPLPETQFQVWSVLYLKETGKTYEKTKGIREGKKFKTDHKEYNIVAYRPVTKRWVCTKRPFLGNGSINTFPLLGSGFLINPLINIIHVSFEVLSAVAVKSFIFWDIFDLPEEHVASNFRVKAWNRQSAELSLMPASYWYLAWLTLRPWRRKRYIPPRHQLTFTRLQGVISQKLKLFIV